MERVKPLLGIQLNTKMAMEKFMNNYRKDGKDRRTESYYSRRLQNLSDYWIDFKKRNCEIIEKITPDQAQGMEYFSEDIYTTVEEFYIDSYAKIEQDFLRDYPPNKGTDFKPVSNDQHPIKIIQSQQKEDIKLPRIKLPKFDGNYLNWKPFYDLFKSLIHDNPSIPAVQKLQYLKLQVEREAEHLLRQFQVTENNYESAWNLLVERYDNNRVLVEAQLNILFSQPAISSQSSNGIKKLLDTTNECLMALENLGIDCTNWDPIIVHFTVKKLPTDIHRDWELQIGISKELPTWDMLKTFLAGQFRALEAVANKQQVQNKGFRAHDAATGRKGLTQVFHISPKTVCSMCSESHNIRQCSKFALLDHNAKLGIVRAKGLCINCLGQGHVVSKCPSRYTCVLCKQKHHKLLHHQTRPKQREERQIGITTTSTQPGVINQIPETSWNTEQQGGLQPQSSTASPTNTFSVNSTRIRFVNPSIQSNLTNNAACNRHILLATALVRVDSPLGMQTIFRALIDPGSQASFVTEAVVQSLQLKKYPIRATVSGLGQSEMGKIRSKVRITLKSTLNDTSLETEVLVLSNLTQYLPSREILSRSWPHLQGLQLADPHYEVPGKVDLLLGADIYASIILQGLRRGTKGTPTAQETTLGWILFGEVIEPVLHKEHETIKSFFISSTLEQQLRLFWELEEIPIDRHLSEEERTCDQVYADTYHRDVDGRYVVALPFVEKPLDVRLGKSRDLAVSRLLQLERRFAASPQLHQDYAACINEYMILGHMMPADGKEEEHVRTDSRGEPFYTCSYLPHHAVVKDASSTTKLRVVFDASQKTSNGRSLNDVLLKGPTIQEELAALLLHWRKYKIGFMADAEKMYRQIKVTPQDTNYQRIVWRESPNLPISDYKLTTVTFGTKSAPYLAVRTLKQLSVDEQQRFPIGAETVASEFYVDDLTSGGHSIEDALEKQRQVISIMKAGGFNMRKWASNHEQILMNVPKEAREVKLPLNIIFENNIKALGMNWNPVTDQFSYSIHLEATQSTPTKRNILSDVSKLFDPLGWLAPITVSAKIMIQMLWLAKLDWDDPTPEDISDQWRTYRNNLSEIQSIKMPRWLRYEGVDMKVDLHGFCDASIRAYAAAVYLRITDIEGNIRVYLLSAKVKVAPIKTISLPRLELCGAVTLSKLIAYIQRAMKLHIGTTYAWTDSNIVLAWLKGHPSKWKTFVANRVTQIHERLGTAIWRHVPSKDNPADCASRGISPQQLRNHPLWWYGPSWLKLSMNHWPNSEINCNTDLETRKLISLHIFPKTDWDLAEKYSSLPKLIRVTAYCKRFIFNVRNPQNLRKTKYLTVEELNDALLYWIHTLQVLAFSEEMNSLKYHRRLKRSSKLIKLNPFIHQDGTLRVGGRLRHAELDFDQKHPIILPSKHHLTNLILDQTHKKTMHGGPQLMLSTLSRRYWIINARQAIKRCIHNCITCHRQKMSTRTQLMGDLPRARVQIANPFTHTGVDYCGPFDIKMSKGRGAKSYKGYIAIFICLATKAIHIELVSDQTTSAFLAAFRRFVSRRGLCTDIYSDCGSNFIGANQFLTRQRQKIAESSEDDIAKTLANEGIKWHFIPPASPHFGGLWEAGVKSIKYHLKRILGQSLLTYEEFTTILHQIEACLNSRPICEISTDPDDISALTPGHFLIGRPLLTLPESNVLDLNIHTLDRWQYLQRLHQSFWKRWSSEYLNRLQQRPKWNQTKPNLKVGELVLIKDDKSPPSRWLLGRIIQIHPGSEGLVRVVTVNIKNGPINRPITKICFLPVRLS